MSRIQTNKLVADLNTGILSEKYEIFNVRTSDMYFGKGNNAAKLVDDFTNEKFVLSVVYERGNSFYMLLKKSVENQNNINEAVQKLHGTENITVDKMYVESVPQNIIVQLLLNSMGTYEGAILGYHNVTGHFYINHPSWVKPKRKQIVSLELRVTKEMLLDWNVRTFTSITQQRYIRFGKKKFNEYPEYVLGKDNILKRIEKGSSSEAYILRQIGDDKTNIKFLEIDSLEKFQKTKMGVICDCIDKFNTKFSGVAHLEFDSFNDYQEEQISSKFLKGSEQRIKESAPSHKIVLVDGVLDPTSPLCIERLKQKIKEQFGCDISVYKRPKVDAINIVLIHEDDFYKDNDDPHDKVYKDCAIQHVTIETIAHLMSSEKDNETGWKSILDCIMQEVLIKEDIVCNHISMVNWSDYGFIGNIVFGICYKGGDDCRHFYFMTISPNGDFTIAERENTIFEHDEYQECIDIFDNEDVVGVVKYGDDVNVIRNTRLKTIPEIEHIKERLQNNDNKIRDKISREELFPAITDIKCFSNNNNSMFYFSGIIGTGMRRVIPTAANIRLVDTWQKSNLFFEKLLKLMAVTFVRNGQLTVVPFPFKYLLEFARTNA